jgi:hypothetical protein
MPLTSDKYRAQAGDYVSVQLPDGEVRGTMLTDLSFTGLNLYVVRVRIGIHGKQYVDLNLNHNQAPLTRLFSAWVARGETEKESWE